MKSEKETIIGTASVELIRENPDGSADYMFNFPPEAMAALTRLGIMTAIQAGVDEAKRYEPDDEEEPPAPVMDDNIKRLAAEAGFTFWSDDEWKPEGAIIDWAAADNSDLVRFYHLIVRECVMEAIDEVAFQGGSVAIEAGIRQRLYTHFGVEE